MSVLVQRGYPRDVITRSVCHSITYATSLSPSSITSHCCNISHKRALLQVAIHTHRNAKKKLLRYETSALKSSMSVLCVLFGSIASCRRFRHPMFAFLYGSSQCIAATGPWACVSDLLREARAAARFSARPS
jgi:hypothetical protein